MERLRVPDDFQDRYPGGSPLSTEAAMNLVRTGSLVLDRVAEIVRPLGLTPASALVLGILADAGPLPPSVIGERLIVTGATVTGLIDSLERRGYAGRTPNPADRRSVFVELTDEGRWAAEELRRAVHGRQRHWMEALTEPQQRTLIRLLHRIQDHLDAHPSDVDP